MKKQLDGGPNARRQVKFWPTVDEVSSRRFLCGQRQREAGELPSGQEGPVVRRHACRASAARSAGSIDRLLVLLIGITFAAIAVADTPREIYAEAFHRYVSAIWGKRVQAQLTAKGMPAADQRKIVAEFNQGMTRCHMESMSIHDHKVRQAAYDAASDGGSYIDAKHAFERTLLQAMEQDDQSVLSKFEAVELHGMACIREEFAKAGLSA